MNESGFEPLDGAWEKKCNHLEHEPPMHICIPAGQQYRHVCPGCGKMNILRPPHVIC